MAASRKHTLPPKDLGLPRTIHEDRHKLEDVQVPIVTVSASFHSDIAKNLGEHASEKGELAFSRAHYSMAIAILEQASLKNLSSWLVDPMNYLSGEEWRKIIRVESVGKLIARNPLLKRLKDFVDTFIRSKSPLTQSIKVPLLYVTERAEKPIVSLHYEAGNILAENNKKVLQVVTDPHVRPHYLQQADRKNISFAVFDEPTKRQFLELAKDLKKDVLPERVVVTGPPVDPRIVEVRLKKNPLNCKKRALRLVVTTSGLGTNFGEIEELLKSVIPLIKEKKLELILYASTHPDFLDMYNSVAASGVGVGEIGSNKPVRVIYDSSIVEANLKLIEHAFAWADGFITKPSGDMAYDAVAAGCFLLTLDPWGEWEEKIFDIFARLGIAKKADTDNFAEQLGQLEKENWFTQAINNALNIDGLYLNGAKNIVDLQQKLQ